MLVEDAGSPSPAAHTTGDDAFWLGHAWVDGRKGPADVAAPAGRLRGTGIRDLFVHTGPLADDGTLDPGLAPRARWLTGALHAALPGVRVQSWLGDVVGGHHLDLGSAATRRHVLAADRQVLAEGFDGDDDLEPVPSGDVDYLGLLAATRVLTRSRGALLWVSADQIEPLPGMAAPERWLAGRPHWWSTGFLHEVATRVDEVAIMAYDTALPTRAAYAGYVRVETSLAVRAVPPGTVLLIGVPAFHTRDLGH